MKIHMLALTQPLTKPVVNLVSLKKSVMTVSTVIRVKLWKSILTKC